MNIVAILAGGSGKRVGGDIPKQFLPFNGKMLLQHTIDAFEKNGLVDRIIVVAPRNYVDKLRDLCGKEGYQKWDTIVEGGAERYLSSYAAIRACNETDGNLLIHDAARPFVSQSLITRLIVELRDFSAVVPVLSLSDTLVEVNDDCVIAVPDRQKYRQVQTPQAFHLALIKEAFEYALKNVNYCFTDDCSVLLRYNPQSRVKVVEGDKNNFKLTYHTDIEYFNEIFKKNG
jgi:2-C-methyl-D-erythritol 4-phosphate cytidylyltransferase